MYNEVYIIGFVSYILAFTRSHSKLRFVTVKLTYYHPRVLMVILCLIGIDHDTTILSL